MGEIFSRPIPPTALPFTGERLTSELTGQTQIEHLHRYLFAREFCRGKDVLDVASGEGYGSALLAQVAMSVTGVDIAQDAVAHAVSSYCLPNLRYLLGDARAMVVPDSSIDVVVSFETIEHLAEQDQFLAETHRVLRPGGMLIVSTPDRDNYSPADTPANPYHICELTEKEFRTLLSRHFSHVACVLQRPIVGSVMLPAGPCIAETVPVCFEKRGEKHFEASNGMARPQYVVALASDRAVIAPPPTVYIETSQLGYMEPLPSAPVADAEAKLAELRQQLAQQTAILDSLRAERAALEHANERAELACATLQQQLAQQLGNVDSLRAERAALEHANERAELACATLQQQLAQQLGNVDSLRAERAALQHANERAELAYARLQQQLAQPGGSVDSLRAERDELAASLHRQEQQLTSVLGSTSWRITGPLRAIVTTLRRGSQKSA